MPNPCRGIKGFKETGRKDVYIEDSVFNAVYEKSSQPLRDALDMAYLTGQRPADVPKMTERDISGADTLTVIQNKTNKKRSAEENKGSNKGLYLCCIFYSALQKVCFFWQVLFTIFSEKIVIGRLLK